MTGTKITLYVQLATRIVTLFFQIFLPSSCLKYNKSFALIYCNSIVTIDLAGSLIFITPLLIFTSLKEAGLTFSGFSNEL